MPTRQIDAAAALIAARLAAPYIDTHEHICGTPAKPHADAWAIAWGREMSPQQELHAEQLEQALVAQGCSEIHWYDGLVCWRTASGEAGHLQLTRVATYGEAMSGPEPQVSPDADLPEPSPPVGCCRCERCVTERAKFVARHPAANRARDRRLSQWYDTGISYETEDGGPEQDAMWELPGIHCVDLSLHEAEQRWHLIVLCAPETAREHGWHLA